MIILKWILYRNRCGELEGIHLVQNKDRLTGSYEHDVKPLGSMKGGKFLD
jgi:hypothetical protein